MTGRESIFGSFRTSRQHEHDISHGICFCADFTQRCNAAQGRIIGRWNCEMRMGMGRISWHFRLVRPQIPLPGVPELRESRP